MLCKGEKTLFCLLAPSQMRYLLTFHDTPLPRFCDCFFRQLRLWTAAEEYDNQFQLEIIIIYFTLEHTMETPSFYSDRIQYSGCIASRYHLIPVLSVDNGTNGVASKESVNALISASCTVPLYTETRIPSEQSIFTHPACPAKSDKALASTVRRVLSTGPQGELPKSRVQPLPTLSPLPCLGAPAIPVFVGGTNAITPPIVRTLTAHYGAPLGIIHFSAHAYLRTPSAGYVDSAMRTTISENHASLFQVGVRSVHDDERNFRHEAHVAVLDAGKLRCPRPWPSPCKQKKGARPIPALLPHTFPDRVYLSFSADVFDASLMPATFRPEPGGLFWWDVLHLLGRSLAGRRLVGADFVNYLHLPTMPHCGKIFMQALHECFGMITPLHADPSQPNEISLQTVA